VRTVREISSVTRLPGTPRGSNGVEMPKQSEEQLRAAGLSGFLGLQRSTVGMLAMAVLVGMGERMAERFLPIYTVNG